MVDAILSRESQRIGPVKVYGSRATGRARPSSDLDLVVYPPASPRALGDLRLAFEESDLPIFVDVVAWDTIRSNRLRAEIERDAVDWTRGS
jgi:uncharacterized protein